MATPEDNDQGIESPAFANELHPALAQEVTAEIRAMAESRGEDSAVVDMTELLALDEAPAANPAFEPLSFDELRDAWSLLDIEDRSNGLQLLDNKDSEEFFVSLPASDQAELLLFWRPNQRRLWLRMLEPDDIADVIQAAGDDERSGLMGLLDARTRSEVHALLTYEEDEAGGLMNPRYARLRQQMTVDEAISYLRRQARGQLETIYHAYVLDADSKLIGAVSFRELFIADPQKTVADVMNTDVVCVTDEMDQETVSRVFAENDLNTIPVVDALGVMKGIVTVDDIVDVVQEEATEDIQKFGGMAALDEPYLQSSWIEMFKKRGVWLVILQFGGMLTATALGMFQHQIETVTMLSLFMPLIIASGGNSGSQASTLVIRSMALGEIRAADWWRVARRELVTGLSLGALLGLIGWLRVYVWGYMGWLDDYGAQGAQYVWFALTVGLSLVGVVIFGTMAGAMLPFMLRRLGADPASASAPFVATLVDVTGLVIYFVLATLLLSQLM